MAKKRRTTTPQLQPDQHIDPRGNVMSKVEIYGWKIVDRPGRFMRIDKASLNIDHDYQRDSVRENRVLKVASEWSWVRLGTLSVAERPDGTFWVFDGQHRKLAADKRSDISLLPCMVFKTVGSDEEAKHFLGVNCSRSSVTWLDKFKALVAQNDPVALLVRDLVESTGHVVQKALAKKSVRCVGILMRAMAANEDAARAAWKVAVSTSGGDVIIDRVYQGIWTCECHLRRRGLGSLLDSEYRPFVQRLSPRLICQSIAETVAFLGKGGPKVYGEAVLRILNRGRRNKIPALYGSDAEGFDAA